MVDIVTLGICQKDARLKCLNNSETKLTELQSTFYHVFKVFSDAMQGIWNNFELMTRKVDGGGHLILVGSMEDGVRDREIFESILSVFSLSITPIKNLIFEGSYVSACTLLRANIEVMIQLRNVLEGQYKTRATPRITREDKRIRKIYSEITGVAHLSDDLILSNLTKGHSAHENHELLTPMFRVLTPQFNFRFAEALFALHIACSVEIIFRINKYFETHMPDKKLSDRDLCCLKQCSEIAWSKLSL
jgi:hypothetical protein